MLEKRFLRSRSGAVMAGLVAVLAIGLTSSSAALASGTTSAAAPVAAAPALKAAATPVALPVTGDLLSPAGAKVGSVTGEITRFAIRGGKLVGVARLTGTAGGQSQTNSKAILPIQDLANPVDPSGVVNCQILNLVLGPLDLNLLGLRVRLNRVHLNITAVPGSGNLLGNLLCAVAHLLDGPSSFLANVRNLLNQILDIINKIQNP